MTRRVTAGKIACGWRWRTDADGKRVAEVTNWTEPLPHEPKPEPPRSKRGVAPSVTQQGSLL